MELPNQPELNLQQAQDKVKALPNPKVTLDFLHSQIATVKFLNDNQLTICVATLWNGFKVLGKAAPADPNNYDKDIGQRYAFEDVVKQLWGYLGFRLCDARTGGVADIGGSIHAPQPSHGAQAAPAVQAPVSHPGAKPTAPQATFDDKPTAA